MCLPRIATTMILFGVVLLGSGCAHTELSPSGSAADADAIRAAFVVRGEGNRAIARVITDAPACPALLIDGTPRGMVERVSPATYPARSGNGLDGKEVAFPVRTCERTLPSTVTTLRVGAIDLPVPKAAIQRIVIVADTGCRLKQSESAYQDCNDARKWPFARIADQAAALHPDLVIHIGDLHYRESPCPATHPGCAASPWGYGFDTWKADFFDPAKTLLTAAPWVFVRGNHESCWRAGQGWFRFFDARPWSAARSCNQPAFDTDADYSEPYAVKLTPATQLIVFDSSRSGSKANRPDELIFQKYLQQLRQVAELATQAPHNFFVNHHPVLGLGGSRDGLTAKPGSEGLQSVMQVAHPGRLFAPQVDLALHGHVHLFEALGFSSDHPATLVLGNSGSAMEGRLPASLPPDTFPAPGAAVNTFATQDDFGFASLDRNGDDWTLSEWNVDGQLVIRCELHGPALSCPAR